MVYNRQTCNNIWRLIFTGRDHYNWSAKALRIIAIIMIAALLLTPIIAVAIKAVAPLTIWVKLAQTVLLSSLTTTLILIIASSLFAMILGTGSAWLISVCQFPGRQVLNIIMVLPLTIPAYILAYCYGEILDYTGVVQTTLRYMIGARSINDYWFPDLNSTGGAIFIMTFAFYPYVFITSRSTFMMQSGSILDVARMLGCGPWRLFYKIGLPIARPAIIAGVTLLVMEVLNDIGAVRYLGVQTLTASIYDIWLNRSDLVGAAQIAGAIMVIVAILLIVERGARNQKSYCPPTPLANRKPKYVLSGWSAVMAIAFCLTPVLVGFVFPTIFIIDATINAPSQSFGAEFQSAAANSLLLTLLSVALIILIGLSLIFNKWLTTRGLARIITRSTINISTVGYAMPGTIIALGVLLPVIYLNNIIGDYGIKSSAFTATIISIIAIVYAYTIRFMAPALGALDTGIQSLPPSTHNSAKILGKSTLTTIIRIDLPIMKPAIAAAALIITIDCLKELPATLILRTFNFETLATLIFTYVDNESFRYSAPAALAIIASCIIPVIYLGHISYSRPREHPTAQIM